MNGIDDDRQTRRMRFDTRRRELRVTWVEDVSPGMRRINLIGDMTGFQSLGFDDHVKLFLPDPQTGHLTLPDAGDDEKKPIMRDYTPRRFDADAGRLVIDFALHPSDAQPGPATAWAQRARPGDSLHIGGPRGSQVISDAFAAYMLIGDETALPAIGRRLEGAAPGTRITVQAEIAGAENRLGFETRADADIRWVMRSGGHGPRSLAEAIATLPVIPDTHVWAAGEGMEMRQLRGQLVQHGFDSRWLKVAGYWRRGAAGAHEPIE